MFDTPTYSRRTEWIVPDIDIRYAQAHAGYPAMFSYTGQGRWQSVRTLNLSEILIAMVK